MKTHHNIGAIYKALKNFLLGSSPYYQGETIEVLSHDWVEAEFLCMEGNTVWVKGFAKEKFRLARAYDHHRKLK